MIEDREWGTEAIKCVLCYGRKHDYLGFECKRCSGRGWHLGTPEKEHHPGLPHNEQDQNP